MSVLGGLLRHRVAIDIVQHHVALEITGMDRLDAMERVRCFKEHQAGIRYIRRRVQFTEILEGMVWAADTLEIRIDMTV